jgi:cyclic beta-1,2-glucan synthetase
MFEYLMPLLVMRSYPETLLDETCRMVVQRQIQYGEERDVPWGVSECAYNVVDRHGTYQYRAFGVPGLGLRRGLGDDLVVAPYATALAVMVEPAAAVENLRRLGNAGLMGAYGYYDAVDYTSRDVAATDSMPVGRKRRRGWPGPLFARRWRIIRAWRSCPLRMPCSGTGWSNAFTGTPASRRPNCCSRSAYRGMLR